MTKERVGLARTADSDLAAALRLKRLLMALNELLLSLGDAMPASDRSRSHMEMLMSSTALTCLVTHGLSTIERIEDSA